MRISLYPSCNNTFIRIVSPLPEFPAITQALAMVIFSPKNPLFFLFLTLPLSFFSQYNFYVSVNSLNPHTFLFKFKPNSTILVIPLLPFSSLISLIFLNFIIFTKISLFILFYLLFCIFNHFKIN